MDHCYYSIIILCLRAHNHISTTTGKQNKIFGHISTKPKSLQSFQTKETHSSPFAFNSSDSFVIFLNFNKYPFTEVIFLFCLYQLQLLFCVIQINCEIRLFSINSSTWNNSIVKPQYKILRGHTSFFVLKIENKQVFPKIVVLWILIA